MVTATELLITLVALLQAGGVLAILVYNFRRTAPSSSKPSENATWMVEELSDDATAAEDPDQRRTSRRRRSGGSSGPQRGPSRRSY